MKLELLCEFIQHNPNNTEHVTYRITRRHDNVVLAEIECSRRTQYERVKKVFLSRCINDEQDKLDQVFQMMHLTLSWKPFITTIEIPYFHASEELKRA